MKTILSLLTLLLTQGVGASEAQEAQAQTSYLQVQTLGFQGTFAAGFHKQVKPWYQTTVGLGYSPALFTGHDIWSAFWQNHFTIKDFHMKEYDLNLRPYLGPSFIFAHSKELFYRLPEQYPASYYPPTAFQYAMDFGVELSVSSQSNIALQWTVLGTEIAPIFNSSNNYKPFYRYGSALFAYRVALDLK